MKFTLATFLLMSLASTAMTCELNGIKGTVSDDGQSLASRQEISLKDQARTYGGYQRAADYLEQNRLDALRNTRYSQAVKDQINADMTKNVADLMCWVGTCVKDPSNEACQF